MTLGELLTYLDKHSGCRILDGGVEETLAKSFDGAHADGFVGAVIAAIATAVSSRDMSAPIDRATATTALGPLRLKAMGDDAPVEDLRNIERIVHAIDGAFNDEALAAKRG